MVKGKEVNQKFPCFSRGSRKKGAAHFEMIISFIFFLGFVFFLFLFLKPYDTTVLSGSVVAALYDTFEEEVHTNLTSIFLKANATDIVGSCFYVQLVDDIFTYAITESRVTNLAGDVINSSLDVSDLNIDADDTVFYRVAISPEFGVGTPSGCTQLSEPYTIGSKLERRVVSYKALETMKQRYEVEYEALKADLKVPKVFEFFIISEDIGLEMQHFVPDSEEVNTYAYNMEVLNSTGSVVNARVILGIW